MTTDFGPRFTVDDDWERLPAERHHADVVAVDIGPDDRVYVFTRNEHRVFVYESDGTFVTSWGDGIFTMPHGLTVAPDGSVYCVDAGDHSVRKFTPEGELLTTLGTPGVATDTGHTPGGRAVIHNVETVRRPAGPFNRCTNLSIAPTGDLYVSDGYGNCCVHRFSPDGTLIKSWGEVGVGPGEFHLPHGICVTADGRVLVGDRENDRIQVFDLDGTYITQWTDVQRPCDLAVDADGLVYVAELWRPRGTGSFTRGRTPTDLPGRVTIFDPRGSVVARWGASTVSRASAGNFVAPHGIAVDSRGAVYVGEVTDTFGIRPGRVPADHAPHQLQKFTRIPE
ncbi:peptidyl-alpha-hydroxyglycine alpha-amidating lyase family protein [Amycolatopsis pigmentata]|uniref:Peptidyl-alpha-hydroxyglycine alpha-amidating lyase family protein n=1 Tax=Amycolatopsis pigmentata TaxID=450801 RepID=A0ABW5FPM3_9PSEU